MSKGVYYVGDPSYFISNFDVNEGKSFLWKGKLVFATSTYEGDGVYPLYDNKKDRRLALLGVDSGMLSCIPKSLIDKSDVITSGGIYTHRFKDDFYVEHSEEGFVMVNDKEILEVVF